MTLLYLSLVISLSLIHSYSQQFYYLVFNYQKTFFIQTQVKFSYKTQAKTFTEYHFPLNYYLKESLPRISEYQKKLIEQKQEQERKEQESLQIARQKVKAKTKQVLSVSLQTYQSETDRSKESLENLSFSAFLSDLPLELSINHYCSIYGCNSQQLYRVMMCESSGNPLAYNKSGASGLFQFMPNTWNYFSRISGIYGDIWDAEDQIHLAAWAFSNGLSYHWVCK